MIGVLKGLAQTWKSYWRKPVTVQYPDERLPLQPRYVGFPGLTWDAGSDEPFCTGCQVCMRHCPTQCMTVTMKDNPQFADGISKRRKIIDYFSINQSRCISCSICVEVCPFEAIEMTHIFERANYYPDVVVELPDLLQMSADHRAHKDTMPSRETRDRL